MYVPDILEKEFSAAAEDRGEDPEQAIQQLMLKYVQKEESTAALLISEDPNGPVSSIAEYNPNDARKINKEVIKALVSYNGEIEIDPADVMKDKIPRDPDAKRELILGVLRHEHTRFVNEDDRIHPHVIRRGDVVRVANMFIDDLNESDHKRREYVEKVLEQKLLTNPNAEEEQRAFWTVEDALEYIEFVSPENFSDLHTAYLVERDVVEISKQLLTSRLRGEVDIERVNDARSAWGLDKLDAAEWMIYRDFPKVCNE